jgi:hypothetical protein
LNAFWISDSDIIGLLLGWFLKKFLAVVRCTLWRDGGGSDMSSASSAVRLYP